MFNRNRRTSNQGTGDELSVFDHFLANPFGAGHSLLRDFFGGSSSQDTLARGGLFSHGFDHEALRNFASDDKFGDFTCKEDPHSGQYRSQVMVMTTSTGPDGKPRTTKYMQTTAGDAEKKLRQTQQAYSDSASGLDRMALERHIGDKGRRVVKEINRNTGVENRWDNIRGMEENERDAFDQDWEQRTRHMLGDSFDNRRYRHGQIQDRR